YVSDLLILTVRKGPSRNFEVFKTIESNEQLQIMEEKESFSKVKLKNGDVGWVQTQYLTFDIPDPVIIRRLNRKLKKLEIKNNQLLNKIETSDKKLIQKQTSFQQNKKDLELVLSKSVIEKNNYKDKYLEIDKKYNDLREKSKNVVLIDTENKKIKKLNKEYSEKIENLELDNKSLLKVGMIKWFLSGAGVIFLGWIIGRTVSSKGSRRSGLLD
ncbi:MAG: TIGR04211 family SH3 domain-containing protein, partial [Desulfobacterales bacterium]|nr:TIGR04211 family SH3 domain-containing protein [Desulfobacterales bacterium]